MGYYNTAGDYIVAGVCPFCNQDTGGTHEANCPCNPVNFKDREPQLNREEIEKTWPDCEICSGTGISCDDVLFTDKCLW